MQRVHAALMDALMKLDVFLTDRGIDWWLDSGSLLGAARYGHLIPWDDDIDIGVRYDDVDAIKAIPAWEWPSGLTVQHSRTDPNIPDCGPLKILLDDTASLDREWFQHPRFRPRRTGVSIDIFSFQRVPAGGLRQRFVDQVRMEHYWKEMLRLDRARPSSAHPQRHRLHLYALNATPSPILRGLLQVSERAGARSDKWGYAVNLQWPLRLAPCVIWPTVRRALGSLMVPQPHLREQYLRALYGPDYLREPPASQRRPHALYVALPP
jgi:lipopolysaccharide cholinephosphotransferase